MGCKMINYFMMKGEMMKTKRRLLFIIYGILIISLGILSPVYADSENTSVKVVTVALKEKAKKNKKKTNNRVGSKNRRKNKKNKKDKKQDKKNKKRNKKRNKNKNKKDNKDKNNMNVEEKDEVEQLPETDKYKPELEENGKNNQDRKENDITPPGWGYTETLSRDYAVLCDYTDKKGNLRFQGGNSIVLPEKGYIGHKTNGENTGKEIEIKWSGSSLQNIKSGVKGSYTLTAEPKENIIIGGKDYGKVKFVVDIIVE